MQQPHIATAGQGAYLDRGSLTFLRQRRQRSEVQGFLADALGGVDHLAAADTKRCNRHEFCPERKGLSTLALIIGLGREEV